MKRTMLRVIEHDDGRRSVVADSGVDIAAGCVFGLMELHERDDTPEWMREMCRRFVNEFKAAVAKLPGPTS